MDIFFIIPESKTQRFQLNPYRNVGSLCETLAFSLTFMMKHSSRFFIFINQQTGTLPPSPDIQAASEGVLEI